jgi:hypothetical protein
MMARDEDNAVEGKDFVWVPMKDSKGNIVKDGKGNAVKTRKFGKNLAPETSPRPKARPAAPAAKKAAPKPVTSGATRSTDNKVKPKPVMSGASRGTANKVKPKAEMPVPGRAIVRAIQNAFSGNGETDAAKISSSGNANLGRTAKPAAPRTPAKAPNRADVFKKNK